MSAKKIARAKIFVQKFCALHHAQTTVALHHNSKQQASFPIACSYRREMLMEAAAVIRDALALGVLMECVSSVRSARAKSTHTANRVGSFGTIRAKL